MASFTSIATGNWNDGPTTWGTAAGVYPGSGGAGDTVTIAGHTVTLNVSPAYSIATITNSDNTGYIAVGSSYTLTLTGNPAISYSGTNSSGFIRVTAGTLTITHDQGAGTVAVLSSSSGTAIARTSTGAVSLSNSGGTAAKLTGTGRVIYDNSSSSSAGLTITGNIESAGNGTAISLAWDGSHSISGSVIASDGIAINVASGTLTWTPGSITRSGANDRAGGIHVSGGTLTITGSWSTADTSTGGDLYCAVFRITSGTINWTGAATLAASANAVLFMHGGTVNLATASAKLALANSGSLCIIKMAGTLNTADAGAGAASIANQSATSYAAIPGGTDAHKAIITGASIPSAADTRYGVTRGWAAGGTDATTGCGVAGGNGLLEIPNSGTPTGTQDATSDACVVSGKKYGSPQRTGSASGGGSTPFIGDLTGGL